MLIDVTVVIDIELSLYVSYINNNNNAMIDMPNYEFSDHQKLYFSLSLSEYSCDCAQRVAYN